MKDHFPVFNNPTKAIVPLLLVNLLLAGCTTPGLQSADSSLLNVPAYTPSAFIAISDTKALAGPISISETKEPVQIVELPEPTTPKGVFPLEARTGDNANRDQFAVLSYHRVGDDKSKYTVSVEMFSEHMSYLYANNYRCLLYTSPSPRDATLSRMPSSA